MRIDGEIDLINLSVSSCWATGLCVNRAATLALQGFAAESEASRAIVLVSIGGCIKKGRAAFNPTGASFPLRPTSHLTGHNGAT